VRTPHGNRLKSPYGKPRVVERTFGWLGKYRRLSKDYEYLTASSEAMIYVAMIHLMVCRIEVKTLFDTL
jgi:transposase